MFDSARVSTNLGGFKHTLTRVDRQAVVGIDIGGSRIKAALVTADGGVLAKAVRPTPPDVGARVGPLAANIVEDLVAAAAQTSTADAKYAVQAVGVVVPGLVDDAAGVGIYSVNLGWRDLDLLAAVTAHVNVPVAIGHDVRAGLLAEHRLGAARNEDEVLFLPVGTGLALALMSGGRVVSGSPWSGEVGHLVVSPGGPLCVCGRRGCLEAIASAAVIGRRWTSLSGRAGDAADVARGVAAGDPLAERVWSEAIEALACVLAPVVAAVGTRLVLVGGGVVNAGETFLRPLRATIRDRLGHRDDVRVAAAALGDQAGSLGAALLAWERVGR